MPEAAVWATVPLWLWLAGALILLRACSRRLCQSWIAQDRLQLAFVAQGLHLLSWPFKAADWTRWGNLAGDLQQWRLARWAFQQALKLSPDWIEAWLGLATAALVLEPAKAQALFAQAYALRRGQAGGPPEVYPVTAELQLEFVESTSALRAPADMRRFWLAHYHAQISYLLAQQCLDSRWQSVLPSDVATSEFPARHQALPVGLLQAVYQENPVWEGSLQEPGPLAPPENRGALQAEYAQQGLIWYDGFLQPAALQALLQLCLRSTFWHHVYSQGYCGAFLDDGLHAPLLFQVAEALKTQFPHIFADSQLVYLWAFKCQQQGQGVALHHDSALVNVNFWLTPDSANLEPQSGGLCVVKQDPPADWDLERYSLSQAQMQAFVAQTQAPEICVPYRQNRVVIFNSRYLHRTQTFTFAPGYAQERINLTLLFGRQPLRYHPRKQLPCPK